MVDKQDTEWYTYAKLLFDKVTFLLKEIYRLSRDQKITLTGQNKKDIDKITHNLGQIRECLRFDWNGFQQLPMLQTAPTLSFQQPFLQPGVGFNNLLYTPANLYQYNQLAGIVPQLVGNSPFMQPYAGNSPYQQQQTQVAHQNLLQANTNAGANVVEIARSDAQANQLPEQIGQSQVTNTDVNQAKANTPLKEANTIHHTETQKGQVGAEQISRENSVEEIKRNWSVQQSSRELPPNLNDSGTTGGTHTLGANMSVQEMLQKTRSATIFMDQLFTSYVNNQGQGNAAPFGAIGSSVNARMQTLTQTSYPGYLEQQVLNSTNLSAQDLVHQSQVQGLQLQTPAKLPYQYGLNKSTVLWNGQQGRILEPQFHVAQDEYYQYEFQPSTLLEKSLEAAREFLNKEAEEDKYNQDETVLKQHYKLIDESTGKQSGSKVQHYQVLQKIPEEVVENQEKEVEGNVPNLSTEADPQNQTSCENEVPITMGVMPEEVNPPDFPQEVTLALPVVQEKSPSGNSLNLLMNNEDEITSDAATKIQTPIESNGNDKRIQSTSKFQKRQKLMKVAPARNEVPGLNPNFTIREAVNLSVDEEVAMNEKYLEDEAQKLVQSREQNTDINDFTFDSLPQNLDTEFKEFLAEHFPALL
eukprot:TRINITY_DN1705_c0_g1_i16.p1 TRINITY_DN1705_c0_g1~~TRINITY_DN1705_c0_g1_i16.p1  ORF type:complete len:729 (-),score=51.95 TRINITY_DN1705_c0_g1_i16:2457-4376(-)